MDVANYSQRGTNMELKNKGVKQLLAQEQFFSTYLILTCLLLFAFRKTWLSPPLQATHVILLLVWLFSGILIGILRVAFHAEHLSKQVRDPFCTLMLTLPMASIEIFMITENMLMGMDNPTLVRDTMCAIIMIILNGMVGVSLLLGGTRHKEQHFNLQGSTSFLSVILITSVLTLILPAYHSSAINGSPSYFFGIFLIITSVVTYVVFLLLQTRSHRNYFIAMPLTEEILVDKKIQKASNPVILTHVLLLFGYALVAIFLAETITMPIDFLIYVLKEPPQLGGFILAALILSPEAISAVRAAQTNNMQRSINIQLGSALASMGLTIPAVLIIGFITGKTVILGLNTANSIMLMLTLLLSMLTLGTGRTNMMQGVLHLLLFMAFITQLF